MSELDELRRESATLRRQLADATLALDSVSRGATDAVANVAPGPPPAALRDVADRVAAEDALRRSEARFRAMIEKSQDGITLLTEDARTLYQSPAVERLLGYRFDEAQQMAWQEFVDPDEQPKLASALAALMEGPGATITVDFKIRTRDGTARWLELSATNWLHDPDIGGLVSNFRDVTGRKRAEDVAASARALLEHAEELANVGSWAAAKTPDAAISWSVGCARIFGRDWRLPPSALEFLQMVHPDDRPVVVAAALRAGADHTACETEHRIVRPTGEVRWVRAKATLSDSLHWTGEHASLLGGRVAYQAVGVVLDITEQRSLEAARNRFFNLSIDLLCIGSTDGLLEQVSASWTTRLGWSREELVGRPWLDFVHPDDHEATLRAGQALAHGEPVHDFENRYVCKDGSVRWLAWTTQAVPEARQVFGVARDVTERRRSEERLRLLETCVSRLNDVVMITKASPLAEPGPEILYVNEAFTRLTGYTREEAIGKSPRFLQGPDSDGDVLARVRAALERAEPVRVELINYSKAGVPYWIELDVAPIKGARGAVTHFVAVQRDTTDRHRASQALRRSEEQLRHAQKMDAIGSLAGGIAHDFNNLLSVILSYTSLIVEDLPPADPLRLDLEEVHGAGLRATELTRQLLAFSRKQILQPMVVDLNVVVLGVEKMLRRMLGEDVALSLITAPSAAKVFADPGQLDQILLNLVVNARDAMPTGGVITIEISNVSLDEGAAAHVGVTPGSYVVLAFTDTGTGMDPATQERIFEPFFTTKERGKGTGLGLSTVYGIVQQSGGHIGLRSEPGHGTTFTIHLPRTERIEEQPPPSGAPVVHLRGVETILLVEDEAPVRHVVRTVLRKHGYQVLEAQNGGEAFLLCEQFKATVHMLLTDVVMPLMSGRQLAERLTALRPNMKVLFVSGYTENTIVHHGVLDAGIEFLPKPILPDALLRKVRQVLDGRPRGTELPPRD